MANVLLILIARVINMLNHQLEAQRDKFEQGGGFREKLSDLRVQVREAGSRAPPCPECGNPMARRKAHSGKSAGRSFWGCTGYPECRGGERSRGEGMRRMRIRGNRKNRARFASFDSFEKITLHPQPPATHA